MERSKDSDRKKERKTTSTHTQTDTHKHTHRIRDSQKQNVENVERGRLNIESRGEIKTTAIKPGAK